MCDYTVESKSRAELRALAQMLRQRLGLEKALWIPIVELLDVFTVVFESFNYEVVPDFELPAGIHADTDIQTGYIRIKESVYYRACKGEGRDRMTIAHEIGHFFMLCFCGFKLHRNFGGEPVPAFQEPEWQAKCFAGEFMIDKDLTRTMSPEQIAKACGVSLDAAKYQHKQNRKDGDVACLSR